MSNQNNNYNNYKNMLSIVFFAQKIKAPLRSFYRHYFASYSITLALEYRAMDGPNHSLNLLSL